MYIGICNAGVSLVLHLFSQLSEVKHTCLYCWHTIRLCKCVKVNISLFTHLQEHENMHRSNCITRLFKPVVRQYLYCSCSIVSISLFVLVISNIRGETTVYKISKCYLTDSLQ